MKIKGLIDEDFIQYKVPSMVVLFPSCTFKCDKECGEQVCQNSVLAHTKSIDISVDKIIERYICNNISNSLVCGGLEPMDSFNDLIRLVQAFRSVSNDDVIIYTGYNKNELESQIRALQEHKNIVIKYGRFVPHKMNHYDDILGIKLASDNQYAERIS